MPDRICSLPIESPGLGSPPEAFLIAQHTCHRGPDKDSDAQRSSALAWRLSTRAPEIEMAMASRRKSRPVQAQKL